MPVVNDRRSAPASVLKISSNGLAERSNQPQVALLKKVPHVSPAGWRQLPVSFSDVRSGHDTQEDIVRHVTTLVVFPVHALRQIVSGHLPQQVTNQKHWLVSKTVV